jgi:ubiquitin C-terminal hydrolase
VICSIEDMSSKRKRARGGKGGSSTSRAAELEEQLRTLESDPYKLHGASITRCSRTDHVSLAKKQKAAPHHAANPRCLYGLGEGKDGIWAKKPPQLAALGQDPVERYRQCMRPLGKAGEVEDAAADSDAAAVEHRLLPVGLRNLGATCYLNAQMQCLFHLLPFRRAVYECQLDTIADLRHR